LLAQPLELFAQVIALGGRALEDVEHFAVAGAAAAGRLDQFAHTPRVIAERPIAAHELDAHATLEALPASHFDQAHFARARAVGAAAGRYVPIVDHDEPHRAFHGRQLSHGEAIELLGVHDMARHLAVFPDHLVRGALDAIDVFPREIGVLEIHRADVIAKP